MERAPIVLVADDEHYIRDLLRAGFAREGFEVLVAEDGKQALAAAAKLPGPIDLLVTDIVMPNMGGLELAGKLCGSNSGIKVLFISGMCDAGGLSPHLKTLHASFVAKPFAIPQILEAAAKLLRKPAQKANRAQAARLRGRAANPELRVSVTFSSPVPPSLTLRVLVSKVRRMALFRSLKQEAQRFAILSAQANAIWRS
jgi:DNA-binding NtrC family response regulator